MMFLSHCLQSRMDTDVCTGHDLGQTRRWLLHLAGPDPGLVGVLCANFSAGLLAGTVSSAITTPLDVAKTMRQIEVQ